MTHLQKLFVLSAALIGAALFCLRLISPEFAAGTYAVSHPVYMLLAALLFSGAVWLTLIPLLKRLTTSGVSAPDMRRGLSFIFICGLAFRAMFFGSTPIYEDDWNRYLWDGAVTAEGINPYLYSPDQITKTPFFPSGADGARIDLAESDLAALARYSSSHDNFTLRINSPQLTTIYPPIAIAVFAAAALIDPLNLDVLRVFFWLSEALTLFLMIKALAVYDRSPLWAALYALNPLVIYAGMNAAHMDVLLLPFLLAVLLWVKTRPRLAAIALSGAAAVKLWPLLLAPIIFRNYIRQPAKLAALTLITAALSAVLLAPMLLAIDGSSGTSAYAGSWQRSSYLFPLIGQAIGKVSSHWEMGARLLIAVICTGLSLWLAFAPVLKGKSEAALYSSLPKHLLLLTFIFFMLSPTGFPWYIIWLFAFLPFAPCYSVSALAVLLPIYYVRYYLGEIGHYSLYTNWLVPLQFGLPLFLFMLEFTRGHWSDDYDR